jgi:hypothetical protein
MRGIVRDQTAPREPARSQEDAEAVHVRFDAHRQSTQHLGRLSRRELSAQRAGSRVRSAQTHHVLRGAAGNCGQHGARERAREAKVANLGVHGVVQQHVARLEVAVYNWRLVLMEKGDAGRDWKRWTAVISNAQRHSPGSPCTARRIRSLSESSSAAREPGTWASARNWNRVGPFTYSAATLRSRRAWVRCQRRRRQGAPVTMKKLGGCVLAPTNCTSRDDRRQRSTRTSVSKSICARGERWDRARREFRRASATHTCVLSACAPASAGSSISLIATCTGQESGRSARADAGTARRHSPARHGTRRGRRCQTCPCQSCSRARRTRPAAALLLV